MGITVDQWLALTAGPCAYCGPGLPDPALDRVDSAGGYEADNVVPCCWTCNSMKKELSRGDFLAHLRRIIAHHDRPTL